MPPEKIKTLFCCIFFIIQEFFYDFFHLKFYWFTLNSTRIKDFFVLSKLQNLLMESKERFCDTRHAFIISSLWHYDTHHHLRSARDSNFYAKKLRNSCLNTHEHLNIATKSWQIHKIIFYHCTQKLLYLINFVSFFWRRRRFSLTLFL